MVKRFNTVDTATSNSNRRMTHDILDTYCSSDDDSNNHASNSEDEASAATATRTNVDKLRTPTRHNDGDEGNDTDSTACETPPHDYSQVKEAMARRCDRMSLTSTKKALFSSRRRQSAKNKVVADEEQPSKKAEVADDVPNQTTNAANEGGREQVQTIAVVTNSDSRHRATFANNKRGSIGMTQTATPATKDRSQKRIAAIPNTSKVQHSVASNEPQQAEGNQSENINQKFDNAAADIKIKYRSALRARTEAAIRLHNQRKAASEQHAQTATNESPQPAKNGKYRRFLKARRAIATKHISPSNIAAASKKHISAQIAAANKHASSRAKITAASNQTNTQQIAEEQAKTKIAATNKALVEARNAVANIESDETIAASNKRADAPDQTKSIEAKSGGENNPPEAVAASRNKTPAVQVSTENNKSCQATVSKKVSTEAQTVSANKENMEVRTTIENNDALIRTMIANNRCIEDHVATAASSKDELDQVTIPAAIHIKVKTAVANKEPLVSSVAVATEIQPTTVAENDELDETMVADNTAETIVGENVAEMVATEEHQSSDSTETSQSGGGDDQIEETTTEKEDLIILGQNKYAGDGWEKQEETPPPQKAWPKPSWKKHHIQFEELESVQEGDHSTNNTKSRTTMEDEDDDDNKKPLLKYLGRPCGIDLSKTRRTFSGLFAKQDFYDDDDTASLATRSFVTYMSMDTRSMKTYTTEASKSTRVGEAPETLFDKLVDHVCVPISNVWNNGNGGDGGEEDDQASIVDYEEHHSDNESRGYHPSEDDTVDSIISVGGAGRIHHDQRSGALVYSPKFGAASTSSSIEEKSALRTASTKDSEEDPGAEQHRTAMLNGYSAWKQSPTEFPLDIRPSTYRRRRQEQPAPHSFVETMDADLAAQLRSMTMMTAVTIEEEEECYDGDRDDDKKIEKGSTTLGSSTKNNDDPRSAHKLATDPAREMMRPVAVNNDEEPTPTAQCRGLLTPPRIQRDNSFTQEMSKEFDGGDTAPREAAAGSPIMERKLGSSFSSSSSSNEKESIHSTPERQSMRQR